ncbi:hypothetical protein [Aquipseudomonas guryensis]|uniref:Uncharacterized protein n=1 Tax=Aquipseudomonas guryensis TaxID=2759165 RepID=A0A7W4H3S6_9GAMM|nr:hypothetical protein [Pseudomonas guryensis]MBB1519896.1 hypothetical protein [Pseudomonas guryensis]
MSPSDFDVELKDLYERSVGQLMTDYFDASAFDAFHEYLCQKADLIKSEHVVSKQVLHYLLSAQQVIESRAEYLPAAKQNIQLAEEFAMLLGLIAIGEGRNDRAPGVPRAI